MISIKYIEDITWLRGAMKFIFEWNLDFSKAPDNSNQKSFPIPHSNAASSPAIPGTNFHFLRRFRCRILYEPSVLQDNLNFIWKITQRKLKKMVT